MVEEAQASRAPTARFIDRFSAVYTLSAVMAVALLSAVLPPLLPGADWSTWIYRGLALLLIGCPCALVLSTPAAITSGIAAAARRGLLVKGGAALETIGRVRTVAFDKTGTLTRGLPAVTDVFSVSGEERTLLGLAAIRWKNWLEPSVGARDSGAGRGRRHSAATCDAGKFDRRAIGDRERRGDGRYGRLAGFTLPSVADVGGTGVDRRCLKTPARHSAGAIARRRRNWNNRSA